MALQVNRNNHKINWISYAHPLYKKLHNDIIEIEFIIITCVVMANRNRKGKLFVMARS